MAFAATDNSLAIDVTGLTKRYGSLSAVDGVSFSVKKRGIFRFGGGIQGKGHFHISRSCLSPPRVREGLLNDIPIYGEAEVPDGVDYSSSASKTLFNRFKGSSEFPLPLLGFSSGVAPLESSEGRDAPILGAEGSTAASGDLIRTVSRGGASDRCSAVDICDATDEVSAGFSAGVFRR